MSTNTVDTQVWYELEYTRKGAEDWYSSSTSADTPKAIRAQLSRADVKDYEFRAVKKTLTTEVIAATLACGHVVTIESDGGEGICECIKLKPHDVDGCDDPGCMACNGLPEAQA